MPHDARATDAQRLREQLMAPDPMQRAMALHALEIEVERCVCSGRGTVSQEASRFTARGIPYYALHDPHFQSWVAKAVAYWEKLQAAMARPAVKPASSRA